MFQKIEVTEIGGFRIGNADDRRAATGCTVIVCENGAVAGVDVRGGGPATRETDLLRSENTVERINAVVLSGGSAFGLDAASGVMTELEKRGAGFHLGDITVPIVCQASLFDLAVGVADVRPDKLMGAKAVENAYKGIFSHGNYGAGTGASVGKYYGMDRAMKTGLGTYACSDGDLEIGAGPAVNAYADVYDVNGRIIAGLLNEDRTAIMGSVGPLKNSVKYVPVREVNTFDYHDDLAELSHELGYNDVFNTTICCLVTNAKMTKSQCNKLASILHDGYARAIKPVHSTVDGDTIFVMTTAEVDVNFDAFAALATDIVQYSIIDAALSAEDAFGLLSAFHFIRNEVNK